MDVMYSILIAYFSSNFELEPSAEKLTNFTHAKENARARTQTRPGRFVRLCEKGF